LDEIRWKSVLIRLIRHAAETGERPNLESENKSEDKIIAKGELADGYGTWYVREITASQAGNEQRSDQDAKQCGQQPSVRVETRFGVSSKHAVALLLQSQCEGDHLPVGENAHEVHLFQRLYRRLGIVGHIRLFARPDPPLSTWILPKRVLALARRYLPLGRQRIG
jgi:hypothetical protein